MSSDLERMGDLARHVAKVARLATTPTRPSRPRSHRADRRDGPGRRAHRRQGRLGHRLEGHRGRAAARARGRRHGRAAHRKLFASLLSERGAYEPETIVDLTLLGRYYERFADHAVSVARRVVFLVTGEFQREELDHESAEDDREARLLG